VMPVLKAKINVIKKPLKSPSSYTIFTRMGPNMDKLYKIRRTLHRWTIGIRRMAGLGAKTA
jgi:hypothetical protein